MVGVIDKHLTVGEHVGASKVTRKRLRKLQRANSPGTTGLTDKQRRMAPTQGGSAMTSTQRELPLSILLCLCGGWGSAGPIDERGENMGQKPFH